MPTPYKLKLLNGVLKLKTFSDQVLSIFGIKDLGTRTGNVSNGVVDWSIQHLTKTTAQWTADTTTILLDGQIGVENTGTTTYKFKIGNGVDLWSALGYAGGGSSSGVTSFNSRTGVVLPASGDYTKSDVGLGNVDNTSDANKPISSATQTALDGKVDENAAITGATKTKITYDAKGLVTNGSDATTADIADSLNARYVTDAQLTIIGNTSGTNSGDNATNTTSNAYADAKITQVITNGVTDKAPSEDAVFDALALKATISQLPYDVSSYRKSGSTAFKNYYTQAVNAVATGVPSRLKDVATYCPLVIGRTTVLDEIGMSVTTAGSAGSVIRIAIYSSLNGLPDQLVLNAGTILCDSATSQLITGLATTLQPGLYFLYMNSNSTSSFATRGITPTGTAMLMGYTSALGSVAINYYDATQIYTATPPTTALAPTAQVTSIAQPAFYMYFSS